MHAVLRLPRMSDQLYKTMKRKEQDQVHANRRREAVRILGSYVNENNENEFFSKFIDHIDHQMLDHATFNGRLMKKGITENLTNLQKGLSGLNSDDSISDSSITKKAKSNIDQNEFNFSPHKQCQLTQPRRTFKSKKAHNSMPLQHSQASSLDRIS